MRYDWILFDADHTLFDFDRSAEEALLDTLEHHGIPGGQDHWPTYHAINKACWADFENGKISRETMRLRRFNLFFEEIGARVTDVEIFASQYLQALPTRPYFMDGAIEVLTHLHGLVKMGMITNGLREVQRPRLQRADMEKYFELIVISGEIDLTKPDYAFFDHTHTHMGRPEKDRVLVVGDSLNADIRGGAMYGYKTCWYNPLRVANDHDVTPDFEIEALHQVLSLLEF